MSLSVSKIINDLNFASTFNWPFSIILRNIFKWVIGDDVVYLKKLFFIKINTATPLPSSLSEEKEKELLLTINLGLDNQLHLSKMYYYKFTRRFAARKYRLFLYRNSSIVIKKKIFQKTFGYKKNKKRFGSLKHNGLHSGNFKFSWHAIALWSLRFRNINKKFRTPRARFRKKVVTKRPIFVNLYNLRFLSKYASLRYSWYDKYELPFNIFYEHANSVNQRDINAFLHKFVGLFTFSGKKYYALKLTISLRIYAQRFRFNFYQLLRHLVFHFIPFIHSKAMIVRRRRIIKPTLLLKDKAFFFSIKWWKEAARGRKGHALAFNLFEELREIFENKGAVVQKFRQGLVTAYNARSDLKVRGRNLYAERRQSFLWGVRFRKFLNKFVHNSIARNKKWEFKFLRRRRVSSSFIIRKFLLKSIKRKFIGNLDLKKYKYMQVAKFQQYKNSKGMLVHYKYKKNNSLVG